MDFQQWVFAYQQGDLITAGQVENRFSDQFRKLFDTWRDLPAFTVEAKRDVHGINTVFANKLIESQANGPSEQLINRAKATFQQAEEARGHASRFQTASLIFGLALILGIICLRMSTTISQIVVLLCSECLTLLGGTLIISLPAQF
jgi:hypothetical protein